MAKKNFVRTIIQLGAVGGFAILFLKQDYVQASQPFFTWVGWLDPLQGFAAVIRGHWPWMALVSLGALLVASQWGRLFCGWICPVGTVLDLTRFIKQWIKLPDREPGQRAGVILRWLRWIFLGCVIGLLLAGCSIALFLNPLVVGSREIFRIMNGLVPWSIIGFSAVGLVTFPRFWCRFLCPAGSILNLAGRLGKRRYIAGQECKRCRQCVRSCPMQNVGLKSPARETEPTAIQVGADCLNCGQCAASCPFHCLLKERVARETVNEGRRDFFTAAGVGLGTMGVAYIGRKFLWPTETADAGNHPRRWLRLMRPPGALAEEAFTATCNRCGQCFQVCPTKVLTPAGLEAGIEGLWTPRFKPYRGNVPGRCMFCMACGQVCPTRALAPVAPETVRLGVAAIDPSKCLAWAKGTQCLLCVETCPRFAIQIDSTGRHPVIEQRRCNGCGSCEAHCPVTGSAVILTHQGETRRNR